MGLLDEWIAECHKIAGRIKDSVADERLRIVMMEKALRPFYFFWMDSEEPRQEPNPSRGVVLEKQQEPESTKETVRDTKAYATRVAARGKTFPHRHALKSYGFIWDGEMKAWTGNATPEAVEKLKTLEGVYLEPISE